MRYVRPAHIAEGAHVGPDPEQVAVSPDGYRHVANTRERASPMRSSIDVLPSGRFLSATGRGDSRSSLHHDATSRRLLKFRYARHPAGHFGCRRWLAYFRAISRRGS